MYQKNWFMIMYGEVSHYYDVVSISFTDFIDKEHNNNQMLKYSIKNSGKNTMMATYIKN